MTPKTIEAVQAALQHASQSEHHSQCALKKRSSITCTCHVQKCASALAEFNHDLLPAGHFEVRFYETQEVWDAGKGPTGTDDVDTLEDAKALANHKGFAHYYQAVVIAVGKHEEYESGEGVYTRTQYPLN